MNIYKAFEREPREKNAIYASDFGKPAFDLVHSLRGTPKTNPPDLPAKIIMHCGKEIEEGFVRAMREAGEFMTIDQCKAAGMPIKGDQVRVENEMWGFPLHGYVDAFTAAEEPVEIKSFYGPYYGREIENGKIRYSYLCQLGNYMLHFNKPVGYMVHIHRGTGETWVHKVTAEGREGVSCCGSYVDMANEAKRLLGVFTTASCGCRIIPDYEYHPEVTPKLLANHSEDNIKKAIKGQKILSDHPFYIQYSDWKDLWLAEEAKMKGCSVEDLMKHTPEEKHIMEMFIGYRYNKPTNRFRKIN